MTIGTRIAVCLVVLWLVAGCHGPEPFSTARPFRPLADLQAAAGHFRAQLDEPRFETSAAEVEQSTTNAINRFNHELDNIGRRKPEDATFTDTLPALDRAHWELSVVRQRMGLLNQAGTNQALRAAAADAERQFSKALVEAAHRPEIYAAVKALSKFEGSLKGEDLRLLKAYLEKGKDAGLEFAPEQHQRLKQEWNMLSEAELEFVQNVCASAPQLKFTRAELKGASSRFLRQRCTKVGPDDYLVPVDTPFGDLRIEETRKRLWLGYNNAVAEQNRPLLQRIMEMRRSIAGQLGYASWADFELKGSLAGTPAKARAFCESLSDSVKVNFQTQLAEMAKIKARETGNPSARIEQWDFSYYGAQRTKRQHGPSERRLARYFPTGHVLDGLFDLCERIMGLRIEPVRPSQAWAAVWLFAVSDGESGEPFGLIYFDPYSRSGKSTGNDFTATIIPGGQSEGGIRQCPVAAVEMHFTQYPKGKRSMLLPEGANALCHEFGHALHEVLCRSKYYELEGNRVSRDFVEVPSEFLEMCVTERQTLDVITGRNPSYLREMFPKRFARFRALQADRAIARYRWTTALALMDLELNTNFKPDMDAVALANDILAERYLPVPPLAAPATRLRNLVDYGAAIYSHAWCEAIAADLLTEFQNAPGGLLDPDVGARLRRELFETGDTRPPRVSIEQFLHRPYRTEALFKRNGLAASTKEESH